MSILRGITALTLAWSIWAPLAVSAAEGTNGPTIPLVRDGKAACTVVVVKSPGNDWLMNEAGKAVTETVKRWSQADLSVVTLNESPGTLPDGPAIILTTTDGLRPLAGSVPGTADVVNRLSSLDEQSFICLPEGEGRSPRLFVVSRSARGVFNGATYLRDFCIDGTKENLGLLSQKVERAPKMGGRAVYLLTIWGHEAKYTAADWTRIFDSFARDGFDRIYFWFSGHFPSKKYPQTYKCADDQFDSTTASGIPTIEDQERIIRAAHERGLKIYLGGALGGWVGTRFLTNQAPGTMKTVAKGAGYPGKYSLCPSNPASRKALIEYYKEMFDALPKADGVFIESADEWGGCGCPDCGKALDSLGSTQFGRAQLSLLQEIMASIWRDHPHTRASYTIGYNEHRRDPAYYQMVKAMSDPRFEWMEARDSWLFPDAQGKPQPAREFSGQVMRWRQYYSLSLADMIEDANRVGSDGLYGLATAFEPGAATGDFYKQIPYPTDIIPYILTGFAWRELTWNPSLTQQQMRDLVQKRFFGKEAPSQLSDDLLSLREIIRASAAGKLSPANGDKLLPIEDHIAKARGAAGPKTAEALDLMSKAVADIRKYTGGTK